MTDESFDWDDVHLGGEFGEFFKFTEIGDQFTGKIVGKRKPEELAKDGKPVYVLDAVDASGTPWTISLDNVDLLAKCRDARVEPGDRVRITYTGRSPSKKGNPMKVYKVEVKRREPSTVPAPDPMEEPF